MRELQKEINNLDVSIENGSITQSKAFAIIRQLNFDVLEKYNRESKEYNYLYDQLIYLNECIKEII